MKYIITIALALTPIVAVAQTTECQTFSDGTMVCFPVGGSSTYGR